MEPAGSLLFPASTPFYLPLSLCLDFNLVLDFVKGFELVCLRAEGLAVPSNLLGAMAKVSDWVLLRAARIYRYHTETIPCDFLLQRRAGPAPGPDRDLSGDLQANGGPCAEGSLILLFCPITPRPRFQIWP